MDASDTQLGSGLRGDVNEECGKLHQELPDILAPYKHYAAEVISGVPDGIITPNDLDSEVYPCEDTMVRWHHWMNS